MAGSPFAARRLRDSLEVDVMSVHDELAAQARALGTLVCRSRELIFDLEALHGEKSHESWRSLEARSDRIRSLEIAELARPAEVTGRLATLLLRQMVARDMYVRERVAELVSVLDEVRDFHGWTAEFEAALSQYEGAKASAKQAKARGAPAEELLQVDAAKRAAKQQCQAAGLAAVHRFLLSRARIGCAIARAASGFLAAHETYHRASLDSSLSLSADRLVLDEVTLAADQIDAQVEQLFPGIFEPNGSALPPPNGPVLPPPPSALPPPPPPTEAPPAPPAAPQAEADPSKPPSSPSSPRARARPTESFAVPSDMRASAAWGSALRISPKRPVVASRIQLGAKSDEGRSPSPVPQPQLSPRVPSPRSLSPQRDSASLARETSLSGRPVKALPPVPAGRLGSRAAATERERATATAAPPVMAMLRLGERKTSSGPREAARRVFEAQKVSKAKLQGLVPGTLEVDFESRTISTYHAKKQRRKLYQADALLKIQRSKVNVRKMKIYWAHKEEPQRYHLMNQEERERFVEAACWARYLVSAGPGVPAVPRLAAPRTEDISVWIGSWNMGNAGPPADLAVLDAWMPRNKHDIYVAAVQECDFEHAPGYGSCEEQWFAALHDHLTDVYVRIGCISLLAIRLAVFVRKEHVSKITQVQKAKAATGIGGVYGNKGGVGVSFYFNETALAFVGAHLAARDERVKQRNENFRDIVSGLRIGREPFTFATFCDYSFFCGDLNYRVTTPRDKVLDAIRAGRWEELLADEQLNAERAAGNCFVDFKEGPIHFQPTYRYNRGDRTFSDEKMRTPSWCDRVLWRALPGLEAVQTSYTACPAMMTSDHNAVSATFRIVTLLQNVPHQNAPAKLVISALRVELTMEAVGGKVPLDLHLLWHSSIAEESKSSRPLKRLPGTALVWGEDEPHALLPFVHNRDWLHARHLQLVVRDHRGEYGQAVLSLQGVCDGRPVQFWGRLLQRGREAGAVKGEMQFLLESQERRRVSAAPTVPDEKSGYLLKQGAQRRNWKRRWFECRGGTMVYMLNRDAKQQFGSFSVRGATVAEATASVVGKQNCIQVVTAKRVWLLCADSYDDMRGWVEYLRREAQLQS